jgi:hypothetical protein
VKEEQFDHYRYSYYQSCQNGPRPAHYPWSYQGREISSESALCDSSSTYLLVELFVFCWCFTNIFFLFLFLTK